MTESRLGQRISVPNLNDTVEPTELREIANTLELLAGYARQYAKAVEARRYGHLRTAQSAQRQMDAIYVMLPEWAQFRS